MPPKKRRYRRLMDEDSDDDMVSDASSWTSDDSDASACSTDSEGTLDPLGIIDENLFLEDLRAFHRELVSAATMLDCSCCGERRGANTFHAAEFDADHFIFAPLDGALALPAAEKHRVCMPCFKALKAGHRPRHAVIIAAPHPLFSDLSQLDINIIRPHAPVCVIKTLPHGGAHAFTGHSVVYSNEVVNVSVALPRDPAKAGVLYAVKRSSITGLSHVVPFHPDRIREILPQLIAEHPAYKDIEIDERQLQKLRTATPPQPLQVSDSDSSSSDEDADGDDDKQGDLDPPRTTLVLSNDDQMARALDAALSQNQNQQPFPLETVRPRYSWEARVQSTSEAYAEFYLKTFPHLFSMLPAVPADLSELQFAQHLLRYGDGRFARDEEFVCVVYSRLKQRRAAGICWKACGGSDTPPTKELLQHTSAVAKGDAEVTKKRCRRCELCNRMQKRCLVRSCTWPQNAARCYPG